MFVIKRMISLHWTLFCHFSLWKCWWGTLKKLSRQKNLSRPGWLWVCHRKIHVQSNLDISNEDISNSAKLEASYLNQKHILIAFSNNNLALDTFLQVQITGSANKFALRVIWTCKKKSHQLRDIEIWLYKLFKMLQRSRDDSDWHC